VIPRYKIEVYDPTPALRYSLEDDVATIRTHDVLTDGTGTFQFTLPTKKGNDYMYYDINPYDIVKIWLWDSNVESCPTAALMIGRIYTITAPLNINTGWMRIIEGKNQTEILERRIKTRKVWITDTAHDIADELANDLSLAKDTDACAIVTPLTVDNETYFDVFKKISDYWTSGGSVQKDFYVYDNAGTATLAWKTRPIRTVGVETLTQGINIVNYTLLQDTSNLRNNITVYGEKAAFSPNDPTALGRKYPVNGDSWTWINGWVADKGTVSQELVTKKIGADCTKCVPDGNYEAEFEYDFSETLWVEGLAGYSILEFYLYTTATFVDHTFYVRLWCPDEANYYEAALPDNDAWNAWKLFQVPLGTHNTYDATTNPDGQWVAHGSPTWETIGGVEFYMISGSGYTVYVDGLCFNYGRWRNTTSNGASITAYGQRDLIVVDDQLGSDAECQSRAETLLYQLKDPVKKLDVTTPGNRNILKGDRLSITLPAENISAANYDVLTVDHFLDVKEGWLTKAALVNSPNVRSPPATSPDQIIIRQFKKLQDIARGMQTVNR